MRIELPPNKIAESIERASMAMDDEPRAHFGLSQAGHHCARWLWLSFRWAIIEREHTAKGNILTRGQLLRLFARGHREESHVVALLERAGFEFAKPAEEQFRVSFGGHVSGSLDGIITSGVPGAEKSPHVFECKTHSLKSFTHLIAHGVEKSKPIHEAQCQSYMHGTHKKWFGGPRNVKRALYLAVCKDDDRIYTSRLRYEPESAERTEARALSIVSSPEPPAKISTDPTWYQCRMCSAHDFCHVSKVSREVNCRTCAHSTPEPDGSWSCARHGPNMTEEWTREVHGCHAMHPSLVPWDIEQLVDGVPVYATEDGFISDSERLVKLRLKR